MNFYLGEISAEAGLHNVEGHDGHAAARRFPQSRLLHVLQRGRERSPSQHQVHGLSREGLDIRYD